MVILVAVMVALIAAAALAYALSDTIAIALAAVVAAFGILAVMGSADPRQLRRAVQSYLQPPRPPTTALEIPGGSSHRIYSLPRSRLS